MASAAAPSDPEAPAGPGAPVVEVTRAYRFSAAHRLHNPRLGAEENAQLYGRCNHPSGHGHTYRLEVTIRGPVSAATGGVEDGAVLDAAVRREVIDRFDRTDLDRLIGPADGPTATTEVLAAVIWRILDGVLPPGRLWRLRLAETPSNFFEVDREGMDRPASPVPPRG